MKFLKRLYASLIYIFLYAPILVLIIFSFNESKSRTNFTGFSFKWYIKLFQNDTILKSLYTTLIVATVAAILATVLGTMASVGIMNYGKISKKVVTSISNVPLMSPDILIGVSLRLLFVFFINLFPSAHLGFGSLILAHITFNIPYVILSVIPKLRQLNPNIYEAALDLGCKPFFAFFKVILPQISSGIFSGLMLAFTLSIDDFVVSYFVSGPSAQMLSTTIYSMTRKGVSPQINALSTIMFFVVLLLLIFINLSSGDKKNKKIKKIKKRKVAEKN